MSSTSIRASSFPCTAIAMSLTIIIATAGVGFSDDFPPQIDGSARTEILQWITTTMSERYVDPKVAQAMVDEVRSRAAEGVYGDLVDSGAFLHAVEQDLRAVSDDKHVGLWPERLEDVVEDDTDYTPADLEYVEQLRRTNYGYKKIEILPGNVGYLRIDEFAHPALGGPTTIAVMNTVGNTDALIIDLRWNGGGAGLVGYICGYFFDEATHLNDGWERASGETLQSWTPEFVPGPSLSDVPLYILISAQTFSAAEDFTYALKHLDRATVVGARSKGGGHPVEFVRLLRDDMAVAMMLPNAKSINPITGTSWEGVGVAPDIDVPATDALATAYNSALDALSDMAEDEQQRYRVEWARQEFKSGLLPVDLSREQLAEYAGTYETSGFGISEETTLLYQRDVDSSYPLVPMGDDLFRIEGYDRARFQFARDEDGAVDRVITLYSDGTDKVRQRTR